MFFFVISYYIILEKVKTIMEGVREIMTQKMFTKYLPAQAGKIVREGETPAVKIEPGRNNRIKY